MSQENTPRRRATPARLILTLVLVGALALFISRGNVEIAYTDSGFIVSAAGAADLDVEFSQVESARWYEGDFQPGRRAFGVESLKYRAGTFQGGSLGQSYHLYLNKDYQGQVLILRLRDGSLAAIGASGADMQALYTAIQENGAPQ